MPLLHRVARVPSRQASACLGFSGSLPALAPWPSGTPGNLAKLQTLLLKESLRGAAGHSRREAALAAEAPRAGPPLAFLGHAPCAHVEESLRLVASGHSTDIKPWPPGQTQASSEADCGAPAPREGDRHVPSEANAPAKHRSPVPEELESRGCPGPACFVPGLTYAQVASGWAAVASARVARSSWGLHRLA